MNVRISVTPEFKRQLKPLAKKYKSMASDLRALQESLKDDPFQGSDLGRGIHKVRMSIASKGKGKSGGARVITFLVSHIQDELEVKLLTIYDKADISNISDEYLDYIIRQA